MRTKDYNGDYSPIMNCSSSQTFLLVEDIDIIRNIVLKALG